MLTLVAIKPVKNRLAVSQGFLSKVNLLRVSRSLSRGRKRRHGINRLILPCTTASASEQLGDAGGRPSSYWINESQLVGGSARQIRRS